MKRSSLALCALFLLPACVSQTERDQGEAFAECRHMPSAAYRDLCIAEKLSEAQAERAMKEAEFKAEQEKAEQRDSELQAYGVPAGERRN